MAMYSDNWTSDINKFRDYLHRQHERNLINNEIIHTNFLSIIWADSSLKNTQKYDWKIEMEMIKILINEYQYDVHFNNDALLQCAVGKSAIPVIEYLFIEQQLDPHIILGIPFCIDALIRIDDTNIFKLMIEHGVDINKICRNDIFKESMYGKTMKCAIFFLNNGYHYDNQDFLFAVTFNRISIVKIMLDSGNINIHYKNDEALRISIIRRHIDMAELLLQYGAEVKPMQVKKDYDKLYDLLKSQNLAEKEIFDLLVLSIDDINKN